MLCDCTTVCVGGGEMCSNIDFCICRQSGWTLDVWVLLFRTDKTIQLVQNAIRDVVCTA